MNDWITFFILVLFTSKVASISFIERKGIKVGDENEQKRGS